MDRTIWVDVDRATWPTPPALPLFPAEFTAGGQSVDINIPRLLLIIGCLTTPIDPGGVSLSEFWAWVRYLSAVSNDSDLRLTQLFADLDAHQKTILSDDFGMGVPMYWLFDRLEIDRLCDGRFFVDSLKDSIGATAVRTARRGPSKSPDFVAQDSAGMWHVIECKGTQSGDLYRRGQLGAAGPPTSGAIAQKRTITFPSAITGQRLACGLNIGIQGTAEQSSLKVVDPVGEEELVISEDLLAFAEDVIIRGTVARSLRLAGFVGASLAMLAPTASYSRWATGEAREEIVRQRRHLATAELKARGRMSLFRSAGESYRGRQVTLDLPAPVNSNGRDIRSVRIRQGVNARILGDLVQHPLIEDPLQDADIPWRQMIGPIKTESDPVKATLRIGSLFTSEIELKR